MAPDPTPAPAFNENPDERFGTPIGVGLESVELPDSLASTFTQEDWDTLPAQAQAKMLAHENKRGKNHQEQVGRLSDKLTARDQQIASLDTRMTAYESGGRAASIENGNGNLDSGSGGRLSGATDAQVRAMHEEALDRQHQALLNPEDAAIVAEAAKINPRLIMEFTDEMTHRAVQRGVSSVKKEITGESRASKLMEDTHARIIARNGGDDVFKDGHPLRARAEELYAENRRSGEESLDLLNVCYQMAEKEVAGGGVNRDQETGEGDRDREVNVLTGRLSARSARASTLRRQGKDREAQEIDLDGFLDGAPALIAPQ
jgi:hypothetical protein